MIYKIMFSNILTYNEDKYENILDDPDSKLGKILDNFITFLVIAFAFVFMFESIGDNFIKYQNFFFGFNFFISTVFAIEYIYRFISAKNKIDFLLNPARFIDFIAFFPFFLGLYAKGNILALLKSFKVLKLLKLLKKIPLTHGFLKALKNYRYEFVAVFLLYFLLLFIFSSFVYYVENPVNTEEFSSVPQSLWWGLVTMASLGYGDMVPMTIWGKMIGSILVFLGPVLGSLIGAITIMVFMETAENLEKAIIRRGKNCPRCNYKNPRNSNYCMQCGEKFKNNLEARK